MPLLQVCSSLVFLHTWKRNNVHWANHNSDKFRSHLCLRVIRVFTAPLRLFLTDLARRLYIRNNLISIFNHLSSIFFLLSSALLLISSFLMLCAPSKRLRPFSYHTKMTDLSILVFGPFSRTKLGISSEKCIEYGKQGQSDR